MRFVKFRHTILPRLRFIIFAGLCVALLVFFWKTVGIMHRFTTVTGLTPIALFRLATDGEGMLKATENRTQVLVLGIAGGAHDGADLTDTMLIMSFDHTSGRIAMISLPRDVWSDTLKDKINSSYHYGEGKKTGGGLTLARAVAEDVVHMPMHYALLIDFSKFKKIIDLVGGVDIMMTKGFTDTEFPIAGKEKDLCDGDPQFRCRYETLTFAEGTRHMDGETALKYVRSRHAEGDEGSDFARSRRQQDLIIALKQKLVRPNLWLNPKTFWALVGAADEATDTDMTISELASVGKLFLQTKNDQIKRISIEDLLVVPPLWMYNDRYVLVPKDSWETIYSFISKALNTP